ncbi:hypothetical protein ACXR2W_02465 [Leucobacter sp. HY1908]
MPQSIRTTVRSSIIAASVLAAITLTGCQQAAAPSAMSAPAGAADIGEVSVTTPRLKTADNFRDVAGTDTALGVPGGYLASGVAYRSNA